MKENIPFDNFLEYVKEEEELSYHKLNTKKHTEKENAKFEEMEKVTWEDFENCSKEEMEKIPLAWLYDWTHVTANYDKQDKVEELYSRYGLTPLYGRKYIKRFNEIDNKKELIDVLLDDHKLKEIIKKFFLDNENFIKDVDKYLQVEKMKDKDLKERYHIFNANIGNCARTYILKIMVLKYVLEELTKTEEQNKYLDPYWKDIFERYLEDK